ncbi:hypothetical protein [Rhodobacter sp. 24-YEA-8]|uniref:hypothetical protein n=1 Tax=Rhodobacter sp. 24-YEA-8 TaxID=1884310 RepID=UPI00089B7E81|nr:hypothetical protein [Rhodobacter sp. 24-YEA-8]SED90503.1 hypothetical protein SAMN05519105_4833 [Rhodobacter sp. 24-YEA-8]
MTETMMFQGAIVLYLLISLIALALTYREQQSSGISSPLFRMIGFTLCAIWPVTFVVLSSIRLVMRA